MMSNGSRAKVQLNVYIPEEKRTYLQTISEELDISQSDLVWLMIEFFEGKVSLEEIKDMRRSMLLFGRIQRDQ